MNQWLLQIIQLTLAIAERHQQANPSAPPLTAAQVEEMLRAEVAAGENRDFQWFLSKGLTPPV